MSELIDRYVAAATGRLSSSEREVKAAELRGTIASMLAARGSTDEQVEREVLAELGDPSELSAPYAGRPRYLIGPALYGPYIKLLRTLVAIVASVVFAATLFAELLAATDGAGWGILRALGAAIQTGVAIAFVVTLVFALLERAGKGAAEIGLPEKPWSPESLPEAGGKRQITLGEFIASLVFLTVFVALVVWQESHSPYTAGGEAIPFLDPSLWEAWIPVFFVLIAVNMGIEVWKYVAGRWTLPLVVVNVLTNVLFAGFVVLLLETQQVVNPDFAAALEAEVGGDVPWELTRVALIVLVVGIAVLDTVDCAVKYARGRRAATR